MRHVKIISGPWKGSRGVVIKETNILRVRRDDGVVMCVNKKHVITIRYRSK